MKSLSLVALAVIVISCGALASPIAKNSWNVGGSAIFPLKWDAQKNLKASMELTPSFGYFFADGWEVFGALRVTGTYYQSETVRTAREPVSYGVHGGFIYYFDFNYAVFPYVGAAAGLEVADFKIVSTKLSLELPIGVAFLVADNLLIQIGAPIRMSFEPPFSGGTAYFSFLPGYLGARIFI